MTKSFALLAALTLLAASNAHAASLSIVISETNARVRSIYLDGGADNGNFNTVIFKAQPDDIAVQLINARGNQVGPTMAAAPFGRLPAIYRRVSFPACRALPARRSHTSTVCSMPTHSTFPAA